MCEHSPRKRIHLSALVQDSEEEDEEETTYQTASLFRRAKREKVVLDPSSSEPSTSSSVPTTAGVSVLPTSKTTLPTTSVVKSTVIGVKAASSEISTSAVETSSGNNKSAAAAAEVMSDGRSGAHDLCDVYMNEIRRRQQQEQKVEGSSKQQPAVDSAVTAAVNSKSVRAVSRAPSINTILVNMRQKGNPVVKHIRNVPWQFGDIMADYQMGATTCALYLSLRYHHVKPDYIHTRLDELGNSYQLRVLLVQVDVKDPHQSIKELSKIALLAQCTLILAWSFEEAGRYLETFKAYENKPADMIQTRTERSYMARATHVLTSVKSINKTDVVTLLSTFGSIANVMRASIDEISLCPGFGPQKAQRLHNAFTQPFIKRRTR